MLDRRAIGSSIVGCLLTLSAGCSEFPCVGAVATHHPITPVTFETGAESIRFTYWFEDGAQRVVFDRESIPETARHAVLVHAPPKTSGELHGAIGWTADVTEEGTAQAALTPMALARARAFGAWRGRWQVQWFETKAGLTAAEIATRLELEANLAAAQADAPTEEPIGAEPPPDAESEAEATDPADENPRMRDGLPIKVADELENEGISIGNLKRDRALRVVGARQPLLSDFGLSSAVDVHEAWLFVEDGCAACSSATEWLDAQGIGHHVLRVEDPSNARTLRDLATRAEAEPAVPMLWYDGAIVRGFEVGAWRQHLNISEEEP